MDAEKTREINRQNREKYAVFWANFVKNNKDGVCGKQQNFFIKSLMHGAKQNNILARDYLAIKKEGASSP
ncbi:MAG: hypothetical protein KAJ91_01765 [Candidatus Aenigmarchaeota archaeon]|nr:hypothetical protein [Candidatus Aenigmarchaeota archaeon]MCK5333214.1 hypothetical protein [Candidatus Aenigmarchaeota archaeon]